MNHQTIRNILCEELENLAPEVDLTTVDECEDLRDELDIDSMDFLRLTIALGNRLSLTIPDAEHAKLTTFETMLNYLCEQAG